MSELTREKIYKKELEKVGGEGNNNLERIRSLAGGGSSDNTFVVTLTGNDDGLTQDKTNEEICQALKEGKICNALYIYTYSEGGIELESSIYSQQITQAQKNYDEMEGYTYSFKFSQEETENYIVFADTIQKFKIQGTM